MAGNSFHIMQVWSWTGDSTSHAAEECCRMHGDIPETRPENPRTIKAKAWQSARCGTWIIKAMK